MNYKAILLSLAYILLSYLLKGQETNNLILKPGTATIENGRFGEVKKYGTGQIKMILIPDVGFDSEIYRDFMRVNKRRFTFYAVTLPGSSGTKPPAMPSQGVSYGQRTWLHNAELAVLNLIEKEKLDRPVIAGNLIIATSISFHMAMNHPDKISRVIIFGGMPRASWPSPKGGPVRVDERTPAVDHYMAPRLYKGMPRETWNQNLYQAIQFSADSAKGKKIFKHLSSENISVMARYLLEFYTTDVATEFDKISVPVLVLLPGFDQRYLDEHAKFMDTEYFWNGWEKARVNSNFQFETIPNARIFVWQDQPTLVNAAVNKFVSNH